MGHAIYTKSDPRAVMLKKYAEKLAYDKGYGDDFKLLEQIEKLAPALLNEKKGTNRKICANVDLYSGLVYRMLGIPVEMYTPLFAIARVAGWCAHRIEEFETAKRIIRPAYKCIAGIQKYEAPENRKYYIEFYGDSLTAGYSNIATKDYPTSEEGDAIYQDATQTYGFIASEALNADCSILAMSGVGLDQGWTSNNFMHYFSKYSYRRGSDAYNFKGARVPDLVVIHLGANDVTCGSSRSKFVENGTALIKYIQEGYGENMPIIWAYDPGEQVPDSWREEVLNKFSSTTKVYSLKLEWRSKGKINGHPNVAGHEKNAKELVDLIKNNNLLK